MKLKQLLFVLFNWEQWHYNAKYVLLSPAWLWLSLRARSFYFFAPANPTLLFGGFEGGTKRAIYDLLPPGSYPKSIYIDPATTLDDVTQLIMKSGLLFPIAVKPDVGMMGLMFRKIDNEEELFIYHNTIDIRYIIQELIYYPIEISVFYYRLPNAAKGTITGFVRKDALEVVGDGVTTLETLMKQFEDRPGFKYEEWKAKHIKRLNQVFANGEAFKLSWVANLSRGARLINLEHEKDEKLLQLFDSLSHYSGQLYYGRYDIKCASINDLKEGKNFSIIEFNGTGAEPHHVYGNGNTLWQAFKIIVHHWRVLFTIAKYHNKHGKKYPSLIEGLRFTRASNKHFKKLKQLDKKMPVFH